MPGGGCRHTRPQCPSVNSISASICVCVVCHCMVHPWGPWGGGLCMWLRCHILSRAVPSPVTHFLLIHTRGDTRTAPGMPYPLKGRKRRCGSRLILYGPGARREGSACTNLCCASLCRSIYDSFWDTCKLVPRW